MQQQLHWIQTQHTWSWLHDSKRKTALNVTIQYDVGSNAGTIRLNHLQALLDCDTCTFDHKMNDIWVKSGNLLLFQVQTLSTFSEFVISSSWLTGNRGLVDVIVYDPIPAALSASSGV